MSLWRDSCKPITADLDRVSAYRGHAKIRWIFAARVPTPSIRRSANMATILPPTEEVVFGEKNSLLKAGVFSKVV